MKQYNYHINNDVQIENACVSIAALEYLKIQPKGLHSFYWPCRMEIFSYKKYKIILDGCHNGDSVQRFLTNVRRLYSKSSNISSNSSSSSSSSSNDNNNNNNSSGTSNIDDSRSNNNNSSCDNNDCSILVLFGAGHDKCIHDMLTEVFKPNAADSVIMVKKKYYIYCPFHLLFYVCIFNHIHLTIYLSIYPSFPRTHASCIIHYTLSH